MFGPAYKDLREEDQYEDERLQKLASMGGIDQANYASLTGAQMAGRGLGRVVATAAGKDPRTKRERGQDALKQISAKLAASGVRVGTDEFFDILSSELQAAGLIDEAASVAAAKEDAALKRAQTGAQSRANQPKPATMQERLDQVNTQLLDDPDNPTLLAMKKSLEKILKVNNRPLIENNFPIGNDMVQPHLSHDDGVTWQPIPGSKPSHKFAKQAEGTTGADGGRATTGEVVDPSDPNRVLLINPQVYKGGSLGAPGVFGISRRLSDAAKAAVKQNIASAGVGEAISRARALLTGAGGEELPTESGIGTVVDAGAAIFGYTPDGAKTADKLRVAGGSLVRVVPRFEGPQSDKDVAYYKEVAGRIGDSTLPIKRRLAALDEVENIWGQFEAGKKFGFWNSSIGQSQSAQPEQPKPGGGLTPEQKRRLQELRAKRDKGKK